MNLFPFLYPRNLRAAGIFFRQFLFVMLLISKDFSLPMRIFTDLRKSSSSLFCRFCWVVTWPLLGLSVVSAQEKITYEDHIAPIFEQSCLNCHNPDKTKGGLDLSSYPNVMKGGSSGKVVEPEDLSSSLLTSVMRTTEPTMPPEGDAIPAAQVELIKRWIEGGLPENKSSRGQVAKKIALPLSSSSSPLQAPSGPLPMPQDLLLEPVRTAPRGSAIHAIAASPWAPLLAVTSLEQVMLLHSESLQLLAILPFPEGEPISLAFTPDARYLIVGGGIPGKVGTTVTFDVTTGERVLAVGKEFDAVLCADVRPSFDTIATGSPSRRVKLWHTHDNTAKISIKKHTDWVTALDISPDGILLATGDRNGGVLVWEAETGGDFHTLRAHQAAITRTLFRPDSNVLATSSEDGSIRFWEMNGGAEIKKIDAHPGGVRGFDWARDGSSVSIGRDHKVRLWKPDFSLAKELGTVPHLPTAVALDPEAKRAFVGDVHGKIHVIQVSDAKIIATRRNHPPSIATRLASLEKKIAQHPQELAALQDRLKQSQQQAEQAQGSVHETQALVSQKQQAAAQQQAQLDQAKRDLEATRKQKQLKVTEREQTMAAHTASPAVEEAAQAQQREAIATIERQIQELDAKEVALNAQCQQTQAQLSQSQAEHQQATQRLKESQEKLAQSQKQQQEMQAQLLTAQQSLAERKRSFIHWKAAQINTAHLAAKKQAQLKEQQFHELTAQFLTVAKELSAYSAAWQAEQKKRHELTSSSPNPADPDLPKKCKALEKNLRKIARERQLKEKELLTLRQQIDQQSAERVAAQTQQRTLHENYLQQRSQPTE